MDMRKLCLGLSVAAMAMLVACGSDSGTEVSSELPPGFSKPSSERRSSDGGSDNSGESSASGNKVSSAAEGTSSSSAQYSSSSKNVVLVDPSTVVTGTMTDERDGQTYKTVKIGNQTWMAENLNYAYTGVPYRFYDKGFDETYTSDSTSWCYGDDPANCDTYGRLYTWAAAMDSVGEWSTNGKECGYNKTCSPTYPVRGICPQGWHLPSYDEWEALIVAVDGSITEYGVNTAGAKLKATSGWNNSGNGTDAFDFSALPAGIMADAGHYLRLEGSGTLFWSSTEDDGDFAYRMYLDSDVDLASLYSSFKEFVLSVRCIKD